MATPFLLKQFLERKKKINSQYSLRAMARDLKVSPSYLSEVFSGKKRVPLLWLKPISKILSLDEVAVEELKSSVLREHLKGSGLEELYSAGSPRKSAKSKLNHVQPLDPKKQNLLSKWYYVAILDYLSLDNRDKSISKIARAFDLSTAAVRDAISILNNLDLIAIDKNGIPYKKVQHIRFPVKKSEPLIRQYHSQMMEKAKNLMFAETSNDAYAERLIVGTTIAANLKNLNKIRQRLAEFMAEISQDFTEGECTDIYQLNIQLFPLTKKQNR